MMFDQQSLCTSDRLFELLDLPAEVPVGVLKDVKSMLCIMNFTKLVEEWSVVTKDPYFTPVRESQ